MKGMIGNVKVLVELFAFVYCLAELFGKKLRLNVYVVVLSIVDMFLMAAIDYYRFPMYLTSILYVCIFLYALLYYRESVKCTVINLFLVTVIIMIVQLIEFFPLYYLFFNKYGQGELTELLINIICFMTIIIFSYIIELKKLSDFFVKRNRLIAGVSIIFLIGIGINFYKMKGTGDIIGESYVQLMLFFFIFAFVIYEWQKSRMDAEKKKTQLDMNNLYYEAYDKLIMLIRERQHDMKNHINTIVSMIYTTDNYDELVGMQTEYCNHVMEGSEQTRLVLSVANPLIAGFLYSKIQEAESRKIKFDYCVDASKTTSVVPEYELVEMAGILIDNAVEALCADNTDNAGNDEKEIYVSIKETAECLELAVKNTSEYFEEDVTQYFFEAGYSSKGKGRGIGLSKLKRMVHERAGDIIVSNEGNNGLNYLCFTINIPMQNKNMKKPFNNR